MKPFCVCGRPGAGRGRGPGGGHGLGAGRRTAGLAPLNTFILELETKVREGKHSVL